MPHGVVVLSMKALSLELLQTLALEERLSFSGVTSVTPLTRDTPRLKSWQERGFAAEMEYMKRDVSLLADARRIMEGARTIVMCSAFYDRRPLPPRPIGHGRVARYAWGKDYHRQLKKRLVALLDRLKREVPGVEGRVFVDAIPLLERAHARNAGLGFIGKNTLLIRPREGSYSLLGGILLNVEVKERLPVVDQSCGECRRCLDHCPTGAIVEEHVVDAHRCISYLTIEKRGELQEEERRSVGEWVFGCDVCQDVCPHNHAPLKRSSPPLIAEFQHEFGHGPFIELRSLLSIREDEEFLTRFQGTPLMRSKREGLLRNGAIVAANTRCEELGPLLAEIAQSDSSAVVRQHALWAASTLAFECSSLSKSTVRLIIEGAMKDSSLVVSEEAVRLCRYL